MKNGDDARDLVCRPSVDAGGGPRASGGTRVIDADGRGSQPRRLHGHPWLPAHGFQVYHHEYVP